ncbi:MAG: sugar phosphate isomerase/epimerase family protein [Acidimicrobiales bacterium]
MALRVANGPVSWGVDFAGQPGTPSWEDVFSQISEAGYRWCELGPLGYLPDDDAQVLAELADRGLQVAGSHIFEPIHDPAEHERVTHVTTRTCERIAGLGGSFLVVIDNVSPERGATAGRSDAAPRLEGSAYSSFLDEIRSVVSIAAVHGLTPVLHPHAGTYVEFEDEIETLLTDAGDDGLQLCIDTGHLAYAGMDPVQFLATHRERTPYLHFKDIDPVMHQRVVVEEVAFFDAVNQGVFCPLGQGVVDFTALADELAKGFDGPGTVEQDRDFRATSSALDDARQSLAYLTEMGLAD